MRLNNNNTEIVMVEKTNNLKSLCKSIYILPCEGKIWYIVNPGSLIITNETALMVYNCKFGIKMVKTKIALC